RLLRRLADKGQAVLCTIHQASPQALEQFDRILAVQPGGRTYYFGEIGRGGERVLEYFEDYGLVIDEGKALGDLLMDAGSGRAVVRRDGADTAEDWGDVWAASSEAETVLAEVNEIHASEKETSSSPSSDHNTDTASTLTQCRLLTVRTFKQYWRTA